MPSRGTQQGPSGSRNPRSLAGLLPAPRLGVLAGAWLAPRPGGLEAFCRSEVLAGENKGVNVLPELEQGLGGSQGVLQPWAQPGPSHQGINPSPELAVQRYSSSPGEQCNVNKADVVRILFGQIYSLTMEQQPCLGFVPPVINMHPGLCFPSGHCPSACLCVRLQARESAVC